MTGRGDDNNGIMRSEEKKKIRKINQAKTHNG